MSTIATMITVPQPTLPRLPALASGAASSRLNRSFCPSSLKAWATRALSTRLPTDHVISRGVCSIDSRPRPLLLL